ncbi:MAG: CocE/NonD family hydrolase [Microcella sp.]
MRDGVRLATDVYLPGAGSTPAPAVLIRLPYDKTGRYTFIPPIAQHFADHGFVCITQDVRGKYLSEGHRAPFEHEAADGFDTVEWVIRQPWSNGRVGTWGDSYYGFTQWALASTGHPAHRAMVPRVTGHRFMDMRPGGGMATNTLLDWVVDAWAVQELIVDGAMDHSVVPAADAVHPSLTDGQRLHARFRGISDDPEPFVTSVFPQGNPASALRIPALHTGGWFDNLHFWQLDDWYDALGSPAAEHQFLRMTTIDHEDYRWREHGEVLIDDFGSSDEALVAHVPALLREPIAFLRHYLGTDNGRSWDAPRVQFEQARVGMRESATWPPPAARSLSLPLSPGRIELDETAPVADGSHVTWMHDPANPVPYLIGSEWDQNRIGVPDESGLHERDDVVVLTSDALTEPMDLAGRITLDASVRASTASTHVVARVLDVHPDGSATMIAANAAAPSADGSVFSLRLGDTAYRLPAGHRLRLAIATSAAGQYPVHPGSDVDPWETTERKPARQELMLSSSRLHITIEYAS